MKSEIKSAIIIFFTVIIVLGVVYFISAYNTGQIGHKKYTGSDQASTNDPSYSNMIALSKTFSQSEDKYMVLFFSNKDIKESLSTTINTYDSKSDVTKLYKVNTDEAMNKTVLSDTENKNATTSSDLKIKKQTLIVIENKTITNFITDEDEILNTLQ